MKKYLTFLILPVVVLLSSCEKKEDISGDSSLKIANETKYSVRIYFDDAYIGGVSSEKDETWSVPSGKHTVKAKCSFAEDYEGTHNFTAGATTFIKLELTGKYTSLPSIQIRVED
jgi:hypothetical protein